MELFEDIKKAIEFSKGIYDSLSEIFSKENLELLKDLTIYSSFLKTLEEIKWPLFFISDKEFQEKIINENHKASEKNINNIIFTYCNEEFISKLKTNWSSCTSIVDDRKPLLLEALEMHNNGYYYSSVSILMCQVYGVASDIDKIAKTYGIEVSEDDKFDLAEYLNINLDLIDNEKGKLLQKLMISEENYLALPIISKYIKEEVLSSSDSKERWNQQPLRNKVCHGDQLNFGTKEHSLKAILVIDILITLSSQIENIGKAKAQQ